MFRIRRTPEATFLLIDMSVQVKLGFGVALRLPRGLGHATAFQKHLK